MARRKMADSSWLSNFGSFSIYFFLCLLLASSALSLDTCIEVKTAYAEKGFDESDVPVSAITGQDLSICPQTETCCTPTMEEKFTSFSKKEHAAQLENTFELLHKTFVSRRRKFDEFFTDLIGRAEEALYDMFTTTYGILYKQNEDVFKDLFAELRKYYRGHDMDLIVVMDNFFQVLLERMYRLMNSYFHVDDEYMMCVTSSIQDIKPFGKHPQQLTHRVRRALIAARTFVQGLAVGRDVLSAIMVMGPTDSCQKAIVKMMYCPHCLGLTSTKPCANYCLNTMKGCLANHAELNVAWNEFIDALDMLASRLSGPFNIESVVSPIRLDISEAIMILHGAEEVFKKKIVDRCGEPQFRERNKREANNYQQHTLNFYNKPPRGRDRGSRDCKATYTCLAGMVRDLKEKLVNAKDFWVKLPYMVCQEERLAANVTLEDDCWNGKDRARYIAEVQKDGVLHNLNNPEVDVEVEAVNSVVTRQRIQLQHVTSMLNIAYKGEDVHYMEIEEDAFISGSGSGDHSDVFDDTEDEEFTYEPGRDDDDEDNIMEGSGMDRGSGYGASGDKIITDDQRNGIVDLDNPSFTGRRRNGNKPQYNFGKNNPDFGVYGGGSAINPSGRNHDNYNPGGGHNMGGNKNNYGSGGNNVQPNYNPTGGINNIGGGMFSPNRNKNSNTNSNSNRGRDENNAENEGRRGGGGGSADGAVCVGASSSLVVVLLLISSHLLVRHW